MKSIPERLICGAISYEKWLTIPRKEQRGMLIGISPLISPDLLAALYRMGHGDEIVLADAHFPGETYGKRILRADGLRIPALLDAILPLFALDTYVDSPLIMMCAVTGDELDPAVEASYREAIDKHWPV